MKASDIVSQLSQRLPIFTDFFSDQLSATITSTGLTATVDTSPAQHGLSVGQGVVITGAETPVKILSLTRSGTIATAVCGAASPEIADHDLTLRPGQSKTVTISGAVNDNFNGEKTLLSVPNRQTFSFLVDDSGPTVDGGDPILVNGANVFQTYNGPRTILAVPTTSTFTFQLDQGLPNPVGNIIINTNTRVSSAVSIERLITSYDKQNKTQLWAFVVLGDTIASKDRNISSDATSNLQKQQQGDAYRQQLISTATIFVFIPSASQLGARGARDLAQDLFRPICQSVLNQRFDSGLFNAFYDTLQFNNHGFFDYNSAYYIHQYSFTQVENLQFEDSVGYSPDVAFRNIELNGQQSLGTGQFTATIDLDEVPIT